MHRDWIIKRNRGRWDCLWAIRQLSWYSFSIHLENTAHGFRLLWHIHACVFIPTYASVCALQHPRLMTVQAWAGRQTLPVCFASCIPTAKSDRHTDRTDCSLDVFKWLWWIGWIIDSDCMCFLCLQRDREQWRGMGLSKAITSKPFLFFLFFWLRSSCANRQQRSCNCLSTCLPVYLTNSPAVTVLVFSLLLPIKEFWVSKLVKQWQQWALKWRLKHTRKE